MSKDPSMRPHDLVFATIYDALVAEQRNRKGKPPEEWMKAEMDAVYNAACSEAARIGAQAPTRKQIEAAETYACGHSDYAATWSYRVGHLIYANRLPKTA